MNIKLLLVSSIILLNITSCKKDISDSENQTKQLYKVYTEEVLTRQFDYNSDNTLNRSYFFNDDDGKLYLQRIYEYQTDKIIVTNEFILSENTTRYEYYLDESGLQRFDAFNEYGELEYYKIYTFDNNGCGPERIENYNPNDVFMGSNELSYMDEFCSYELSMKNKDGILINNFTVLYDDMQARGSFDFLDFSHEYNISNIVSFRDFDTGAAPIKSGSFDMEYEYDTDNHPTMGRLMYLDGRALNYRYVYI